MTFHDTSKEAKYSRRMFEFVSILCRHVLIVFIKKFFYSLPSQYVLSRWTINAKKDKSKGLAIKDLKEGKNKALSTSLFNSIILWLCLLNYLKEVHDRKNIMRSQFKLCGSHFHYTKNTLM